MRRIAIVLGGAVALSTALFLISTTWSQPPVDQLQPAGAEGPPNVGPPGPGGFRFPSPPVLEAIDANADGEIATDEIDNSTQALQKLDKNKDAQLSDDELMPQFPGGPRGRGGPGGMFGPERKLLAQFDKDGDGLLNADERKAARESEAARPNEGPFGRGRGPGFGGPGFGGPGGGREPATPGPHVSPADVEIYPDAPLYEATVLRTLFLEFENPDWETELADFKDTDVEVPATLIVDGKKYPNVGVHFRGMSSFGMVPAGYKRSLNLALDFIDPSQRLYGYKTLNLLNSNGDPSFMSSVLYSHIARQYIPAPQANLVKVVINGESWGIYANVQQFNKDFLSETYKSSKGTRWKVSGNPGARGGLEYLGENIEDYKQHYEIKSNDNEDSWKDFIALCKTLNETPPDQLEDALKPMLDIDGVLWFLAIDISLCNSDGYWIRSSDYSIFEDKRGVFHVIPHDMNEAFDLESGFGPPGGFPPGGPGAVLIARDPQGVVTEERAPGENPEQGPRARRPGRRGGPGGDFGGGPRAPGRGGRRGPGGPGGFPGFAPAGPDLDPLTGLDDARKPLRSKLLAVPALKARYLKYVRMLAEKSLDWNEVGPLVAQHRALIEHEVEADTRKLGSYDAFLKLTSSEQSAADEKSNLRTFFEKRREFLLNYSPDHQPASTQQGPGPTSGGPGAGPGFRFGPPPFAMMEALDVDQDSKLSKEEIEQSATNLKTLDEDQDGKLNQDEIGWPPFGRGFGPPGGPGSQDRERPQAEENPN